MSNNINFQEDGIIQRKRLTIATILLYVCFLGMLSNVLYSVQKGEGTKNIVIFSVVDGLALMFAIYYTIKLIVRRGYLYINDSTIRFYANRKKYWYNVNQLETYNIIKSNRRVMIFQLKFSDGIICTIKSYKGRELELVLEKLMDEKSEMVQIAELKKDPS